MVPGTARLFVLGACALLALAHVPSAHALFLDPPDKVFRKAAEAVRKTVDRARNDAQKVADRAKRDVKKAADRVKRDVRMAADRIRRGVKEAAEGAKKLLGKAKDLAKKIGGKLAKLARDLLDFFQKRFRLPVDLIRSMMTLVKCLTKAPARHKRLGGGSPLQALALLGRDIAVELFRFAKNETMDLFKPSGEDPRVLDVRGAFGKYVGRFERMAAKVPVAACFFNFAKPILKKMAPKVEKLARDVQPVLKRVWKNVIEPKLQELLEKGITQAVGVVVGPEAERILAEQVAKHIFDLERIKAAATKVGALAEALGGKGDVQAAADEARDALTKKDFSRSLFVFDVLVAIVRYKALDWVSRGCSGKEDRAEPGGGNEVGTRSWFADEGMSWFNEPGFKVNTALQKLESKIPGGACLIDYAVKALETALTTVRSVADAVCNAGADAIMTALIAAYGAGAAGLASRIAGGVTAACSLVLNFVEETARNTVIMSLKSQGQGLAYKIVQTLIDKGSAAIRQKLAGASRRIDEFIRRLVIKGGAFGKMVKRLLDGALLRFIDSRAQKFQEAIDAYNARLLELVGVVQRIKGGRQ